MTYKSRATHPLFIGTLLASYMSRMTEYIAIEDDNVSFHIFQVDANWMKASLPINAIIVSLQRLSHLMPVDHSFLEI